MPPQLLIPGIDYNSDLKAFSKSYFGHAASEELIGTITAGQHIWDPKTGELKPLGDEPDSFDLEKRVHVLQGGYPPLLEVTPDYKAHSKGYRFVLAQCFRPDVDASILWAIERQ